MNLNGRVIVDPIDIAEAFNDFFTPCIDTNMAKDDIHFSTHVQNYSHSIFMEPTVSFDIYKYINSLKNTDSTGYDGISTKIIKHVAPLISPVLSYIINLCISCGIFPDKLKLTLIKPTFKKNDKQNVQCYRPIALIPIFSKLFERVIYKSLYNFLESNNVFADEQMGFRKNKSINSAVYKFIHSIMASLDRKKLVATLFMDLTKAFDFVHHGTLLKKLESYGVRGNVLKLLESYLTSRKQCTQISRICPVTKIETTYSSRYRNVTQGVPQGSVLGPLLFIIYINDLPKHIKQNIVLFADDSTVVFKSNCTLELQIDMNNTLDIFIKWLKSNNLVINLNKTNLMTFKNRKQYLTNLDINYNGQKIHEVENAKFLGLHLDSNLSWKTQVENLCSRLNQFSYALYMLAKIVDRPAVITAYHGYVESILRYGVIFWGNSVNKELPFKAQKRCLRAICKLKPTDSCRPYFIKMKLMTLPCIYIYEVCTFVKLNIAMYKHPKSKRNEMKICFPANQTAQFNDSIFCMAPRIYNHLPGDILCTTDISSFKNKLKCLLLDKAYYNITDYLNDKISR